MTNIGQLLAERGKTHGKFSDHAMVTQQLKSIVNSSRMAFGLRPFTPVEQEALDMITHKIGRIVAGDPNEDDHWDDIAGYAKLVVNFRPTQSRG